jgi:hypothetical protein
LSKSSKNEFEKISSAGAYDSLRGRLSRETAADRVKSAAAIRQIKMVFFIDCSVGYYSL